MRANNINKRRSNVINSEKSMSVITNDDDNEQESFCSCSKDELSLVSAKKFHTTGTFLNADTLPLMSILNTPCTNTPMTQRSHYELFKSCN